VGEEEAKKIQEAVTAQQVAESRTIGSVSGQVYGQYIKATGSIFRLFAVLFMFLFSQMSAMSIDLWVTYW
jgi:ATP-binding cassette subfamily C (CFTR/MRP) protein 1